ncbi:MAG: hypothetical protein HEQ22_03230 [Sphingopyxis sp.]|uniref:hypothetical protein n=1 Tax=Sphingopyxis sp. TaxID=1908224 RepID=UPI003D80E4EA
MTDNSAQLQYRLKVLPHQLARARERYRQLMREAHSYRMVDLIAHEAQAMAVPLVPAPPLGRDGAAAPLSAAAPLVPSQEGR